MYYYFNVNDYPDAKSLSEAHKIYKAYVQNERALMQNYIRTTKLDPTNVKFAKTDTFFIKCCELAGVQPTARQASKFRRGNGAAYAMRNKANE